MKDQSTVIEEFNELVNMEASELESWLKSDDSQSAGWPKEGADGESVGHDSGGKIIEILKANPGKDTDKYTDDQIQHMRKVVSYCKRHLAQEEKGNYEKSTEEVKKTKSYASLKNWGHDILKKEKNGNSKSGGNDDSEKQAGDKRKAPEDDSGSSKKREVAKGKKVEEEDGEEDNESNGTGSTGGGKKEKSGEEKDKEDDEDSSKPTKGPEVGETVSWNWGNGQPEGKVLDVKEDKTTIKTKKGNEVSRKGDSEDPAVVVDAGKSKAIKLAHELN